MNKQRRNELSKIYAELNSIKEQIDDIMNQEEDAIEALPDNLKESGKGYEMQGYVNSMSMASDSVGEAMDNLSDIIE